MVPLARIRRLEPWELPFRAVQGWVHLTDRWWRAPAVPDGPAPRWPGFPARPLGAGFVPPLLDDQTVVQREPEVDPTDLRSRWDLTRLQHQAGRGDAAGALRWCTDHPPGSHGWEVPIEVAIRLASLLALADRAPTHRAAFRATIAAHAAWIARHPSRGTSANNHRVAELGALALAAHALPDLPAARRWRAEAEELTDVLAAQLHPDGVGVEQSPTYLGFDLEWALLARRCGIDGLDEPIGRGARWLAALVDDTGQVPAIGDDDGGHVVPEPVGPRWLHSVLGAARTALGQPPPPGWVPDRRAAWLGVGPAETSAAGAPARSLGAGFASFPFGGYTVLGSASKRVVVDHGPLGGCWHAAHGHADALAVYVHDAEGPWIVGRGTGRYHGPGRRFHRGTAAHPTVVIDGRDQSTPNAAPFLWDTRAVATLEHASPDRVVARVEGAPHGVVHRRTVTVDGDGVHLVDTLIGAGRHHVAVVLPVAPGRTATITADPRCTVRAITGGPRPGPGWHSPRYGVWVEATTWLVEGHFALPVTLRTIIR
ncbi:MAG: heparinase II/III-family protein [Myxococcota bacterium]